MNAKQSRPKIGQGALQAGWRKGLKELAAATQALPTSLSVGDEPGQLWSITTQGASQQTGVSQPVSFSDPTSPTGFDAMNGATPDQQPDIDTPEINTPEMDPGESIMGGLIEQAQEMSQEPEMEQSMEMSD